MLALPGGATATLLTGRGALQDIDQMALVGPHVKLALQCKRVRELVPALERAFAVAQTGVPGPVFVECPVDLQPALVQPCFQRRQILTPVERTIHQMPVALRRATRHDVEIGQIIGPDQQRLGHQSRHGDHQQPAWCIAKEAE